MGNLSKIAKRKCKVIRIPIYEAELFLLVGGTTDELKEYFVKLHGWSPDFGEVDAGLEQKFIVKEKQNYRFYLWLDKMEGGNLVHEVGHLVFDIFELIGSQTNSHTEEHFCYLLEYCFRECWNAIRDMK